MSGDRYLLWGIGRVIPDVEGFVTPIFCDGADDFVVQRVEGEAITGFLPVSVGEEGQRFPSSVRLKVGDPAMYGFELAHDDFLVGPAQVLAVMLSRGIPAGNGSWRRPRTLDAVQRFVKRSQDARSGESAQPALVIRFTRPPDWSEFLVQTSLSAEVLAPTLRDWSGVEETSAGVIGGARQANVVSFDDAEVLDWSGVEETSAGVIGGARQANVVSFDDAEVLLPELPAMHMVHLVEATSIELLSASDEQLREIRVTGASVRQMADRMNDVSDHARQSAHVAQLTLQATETGLQMVQSTIGGTNMLREQMQEHSRRIARLAKLISDVYEHANLLALNAAIQAASGGETGLGSSAVAEEVQRQAERSAAAMSRIAALVSAFQLHSADAVNVMERSTQGVVESARSFDNAGTAMSEVDRVSRQLAADFAGFSAQASREAESANEVAANIQHIFAVIERTGEGTLSPAQLLQMLYETTEELRRSMLRF